MKPLGVFGSGVESPRPPWATFAVLQDTADFGRAVQESQRTGLRWVLYLTTPYDAPLAPILPALVQHIDASGLRPHLVAVCYHEEWYSLVDRLPAEAWRARGINPSVPADRMRAKQLIHAWVGWQHAAIRAALPDVKIGLIEGWVNDQAQHGPYWYAPVPAHTDLLCLEAYVPAGQSWGPLVEPILNHAVATRPEPIVLIVQGFSFNDGGMWHAGPPTTDASYGDHVRRWMAHPRVVGGWVFDWQSYGATITGMRDLPQRAMLERALGVTS